MFSNIHGTLLFAAAPVTERWADGILNLDPEQRFVLALVAIGCLTTIVISIAGMAAKTIGSIHRRRAETALKREMVERGMTADDIARIIEAAPPLEDGVQRMLATCWKKK